MRGYVHKVHKFYTHIKFTPFALGWTACVKLDEQIILHGSHFEVCKKKQKNKRVRALGSKITTPLTHVPNFGMKDFVTMLHNVFQHCSSTQTTLTIQSSLLASTKLIEVVYRLVELLLCQNVSNTNQQPNNSTTQLLNFAQVYPYRSDPSIFQRMNTYESKL